MIFNLQFKIKNLNKYKESIGKKLFKEFNLIFLNIISHLDPRVRYPNMLLYLIFLYILNRLSLVKGVPLGRMLESVLKNDDFFTGARWYLLLILMINAS